MSGKWAGLVIAGGVLLASEVSWGAERLLSYQAQVSDANGAIHNRFVKVQFRAYDALTGGTQRGQTLVRNIDAASVQNGTFLVNDLDIDQLGLPDDASPTYLELAICADDQGCTPATLSPRHRLTFSALAASALALGGSAKSEDDRSLSLRASLDGSALVRAGDEGGASMQMRLESVGTTGRTALAIDEQDENSEVSVYRQNALANRGGYTPLKFGVGPAGGNQLLITAPTETESASVSAKLGANPAALRFDIGEQAAMQIGTNRVADFLAGQATVTSAYGTSLALSAGDAANAASITAFDGGSPKSLQLKTGSSLAMEVGPTGIAEFFASEVRGRDFVGIDSTASRSEAAGPLETSVTHFRARFRQAALNTSWARAMETKAARHDVMAALPMAEASVQGTGAPELEFFIGDNIVARWSGRSGVPPEQAFVNAPNYVSGSAANYFAPGVYGATIVGGGGDSFGGDPSCPVEDPNCWHEANRVLDTGGAIVAGAGNEVGQYSFVGAGLHNTASSEFAVVAGGRWNRALGVLATIVGGDGNITSGGGFIGGGANNDSSIQVGPGCGSPVIAGGCGNTTTKVRTFIGGGENNLADGIASSVVGGVNNTASGSASAIPGGSDNTAGGKGSFAAGSGAVVRDAATVGGGDTAGDEGTFIWADAFDEGTAASRQNLLQSTGPNQLIVRAIGGLWFGQQLLDTPDANSPGIERAILPSGRFIHTTAGAQSCADTCNSTYAYGVDRINCVEACHSSGAYLSTGGTWTNASARESKENFEPVEPLDVLNRVLTLEISRWNYKVENETTKHLGPVAQDFHAAFGVGDSEKTIATIDADGVALAAIQGLYEIVQEKDCAIDELREQKDGENARLQSEISDLKSEISELKALVGKLAANEGGAR